MKRRAYILNGPNLNLLGTREPHIYGSATLEQLRNQCETHGTEIGIEVYFFQSNYEGVLVDLIQEAREKADAIIINPAGYSFNSVAILDALKTFMGPIIEVHISNIHSRDKHHRHSITSTGAMGVICGLGSQGYIAALDALAVLAGDQFSRSMP